MALLSDVTGIGNIGLAGIPTTVLGTATTISGSIDINSGTIDGTVIGSTTAAAITATGLNVTNSIVVGGTVDGRDVATDGTKLDGIEVAATADQTNAEIRTAVEAATDSNVFTDADHTKLNAFNQGVATTDSPSFAGLTLSGVPTAPTAASGTSTTQIATTAFTSTAIANLVASSPATLDTLNELAAALGDDPNFATTVTDSIALKAPIASPTFTGTATIPTADINAGTINATTIGGVTAAAGSFTTLGATGAATFSGNVGIGISSPVSPLQIQDNDPQVVMTQTAGGVNRFLAFDVGLAADVDTQFITVDQADNLAFGEKLTASDRVIENEWMRITSAGNVGIGTTLPSAPLDVDRSFSVMPVSTTTVGNRRGLSIYNNQSGGFLDTTLVYGNGVNSYFALGHHNGTSYAERFRIDSAGNLLVGKTAATFGVEGIVIAPDVLLATRDGGTAIRANRLTSDGAIMDFSRDGTTVCSIQSRSGVVSTIILDPRAGGRGLGAGSNSIVATDQNGALSNGATDIGEQNFKFRDLYLSGGIKLNTASTNPTITMARGTNGQNNMLKFSTGGTDDFIVGQRNDGTSDFRFYSYGTSSNAVSITRSGNLLVAGTNTNPVGSNVVGHVLSSDGRVQHSATGDTVMKTNQTTAGDIIQFRVGGATVGSIGYGAGVLGIGQGTGNLGLFNATVIPMGSTSGAASDGVISLGGSNSRRFKDLHLSGGVIFGTTGGSVSSKTLDDYEEGTWTPAQGSGLTVNGAYSSSGTYTKIGRMVYVKGFVGGATSVSCGQNGQICTGLPFSPNIGGENAGISMDDGRTASRACSALSTSAVQNTSAIPSTPYGISFAITYQSN